MKKRQNEKMKKRQSGESRYKDFPGKSTKKMDRTKEIEEQLRIQRAAATTENRVSVPVASALKGYKYDEKTERYYKEGKSPSQSIELPIQRKNHEKDNLLSFLRRREEGVRYSSGHYELLSIAHFVTLAESS